MTGSWLSDLSAWLGTHPGWLAVALFVTAFTESLAIVGIIVPGVAILFAVATFSGQAGMPVTETLAWAGLGAVAGDAVSFALGRTLQGRLNSVWPLSRYPALIAKGTGFFRQHGGKSVVIGRFVGPVRPVIPLVAGALLMPWRRFLTFNIASAIGWAPVYVLPGYLVGSALSSELRPPAHFYGVTGISLGILVLIYVVLLRFQFGLGEGRPLYTWIQQQMANYGATHRFWRLYTNHRPAREGEFPLPSLMLALAASALFLLWMQLSTHSHLLTAFNLDVAQWFGQLRQPLLDGPVIAITLIGDPPILYAAATLAVLVLAFRGYYAAALHVLAAAVLCSALVWALKSGLEVPRPQQVLMPPPSGAFPSGHTAGITVLVCLLASFVAGEIRHSKRWQAYALVSLPLLPVAISRLYLGVHWFTDIIGGILLGLAITGTVRASYSRYDRTPLAPDLFLVVAGLGWLIFTCLYISWAWPAAVAAYQPV